MIESTKAPELEATATLDEVVRRRADLYQAILASNAPPPGRRWSARTSGSRACSGACGARAEIADHIEITERPGGLYTEIEEAAPRLSGNVQQLRDEHPEMRDATEALRARLADADEVSIEEARDEIQRVLGRLVKHRQHGADLLWEAYSVDTGGSD